MTKNNANMDAYDAREKYEFLKRQDWEGYCKSLEYSMVYFHGFKEFDYWIHPAQLTQLNHIFLKDQKQTRAKMNFYKNHCEYNDRDFESCMIFYRKKQFNKFKEILDFQTILLAKYNESDRSTVLKIRSLMTPHWRSFLQNYKPCVERAQKLPDDRRFFYRRVKYKISNTLNSFLSRIKKFINRIDFKKAVLFLITFLLSIILILKAISSSEPNQTKLDDEAYLVYSYNAETNKTLFQDESGQVFQLYDDIDLDSETLLGMTKDIARGIIQSQINQSYNPQFAMINASNFNLKKPTQASQKTDNAKIIPRFNQKPDLSPSIRQGNRSDPYATYI